MKKLLSDVTKENYGIKHIAFIMDGNGRWAKERNRPRTYGHQEGFKRLFEIAEICSFKNIEVISVYAFSTENWNRPKREVSFLFNTLEKRFNVELKRMMRLNARLRVMGDITKLPASTQKVVVDGIMQTSANSGIIINICLNYGGRDEIKRATSKLLEDFANNKFSKDDVSETLIASYLDSSGLPEVDLLVRTSGEMRLSNFMLWQLSYAELLFSQTYWPAFDGKELEKALVEFAKRTRRFGGLVDGK